MSSSTPGSSSDLNGFGPRRRSTVRFVLSIAVAVAAAVALYALEPGWFSAPAAAGPKANPTAVATATPKPVPPRYPYLGEPQRVDNVVLTPVDITYTHGNGGNEANKGDVYVIVTLRIENHRGQDYGLFPIVNCNPVQYCNFFVRDNQGEKNPPIPYDPYHTRLRAAVLQDGGYQIGSVTFEVPERDVKAQTLQLLYYHDPVGDANGVVHWLLRYPPTRGH